MAVENPRLLPFSVASTGGTLTGGTQIQVDDSMLDSVTASNTQELAGELQRLFTIVQSGSGTQPAPRLGGPFVPFTSSLTIDASNFDTYAGRISLYARSDDARVNYILPSDAVIAGNYPAEFTILNQGGTARFDTGGGAQGPNNTVRIDVPGANNIRRNTADGTLLNFIEAHQNDLVTLTKESDSAPWVAVRVTLSNAALLLPSGLFRLQTGTLVSAFSSLGFLTGFPAGVTPQAGDAYQINQGNDDFGGYGIETGDVIVALQDNPSRVISVDNDDWIVIRNATNDIISLSEIHFLNTVTETDTFTDRRLIDNSGISAVRLWLSPFILDHAPFITPSTDPNNPQSGETGEYIGGDEEQGSDVEFSADTAAISRLTGEAGSTIAPGALMYMDLDGTAMSNADLLNVVYVVIRDRDGTEISRHKLTGSGAHFRSLVLPGSSDTYYVFDTVGAVDNFSAINYHQGYTIDVVERVTNRAFTLSSAVNVLAAIADGAIPIAKLEPNAQALLLADHSLTDDQEAKLNGLETSGTPTDWTAGDLYVKDNDASSSNDLSHYQNVGQQNGILSGFEGTRDVTFLVPNFVTVTGLQRTDDTSQKLSVTPIGTILGRQAFTADLPSSSFDINNPVGDAWQVDGTASNLELTGAADSFKTVTANYTDNSVTSEKLSPDVRTQLSRSTSYTPPQKLTDLLAHITLNENTLSGWHDLISPTPPVQYTREFKYLFSQDRAGITAGTSQFTDIAGTDLTDFQPNNVFVYNDNNRQYNTSAPGLDSFILNTNVFVGNASGQSTIDDSNNKVIGFAFANQSAPDATSNETRLMVRHGTGQPIMGFSHDEGLFAYVARNDGGQHTRTRQVQLQVDGGHWHDEVDETELAEAEVIIPQDLTGSLEVTVQIQLDDNGNDEGTHTETVTITNLGADQTIGNRTFDFSGFPSVTTAITYQHNNTDLSASRRILLLRPTQPFTNAALTYNVRALRTLTETWNTGTTYARSPVNAGDAHDQFGLFDPVLWHTERLNLINRVRYALVNRYEDDTSSDPEQQLIVVTEGDHGDDLRSTHTVHINRPLSEFVNDDIRLGNNAAAVAEIIGVQADRRLTIDNLLTLDDQEGENLGVASDRDEVIETLVFNGNIEIDNGHTLIFTDSDDGVRKSLEISAGAVLIKNA